MKNKLVATEGYIVESEQDVMNALDSFMKQNPDVKWDGASKNEIVKMYQNKTKPYRHIVFINIDDNWFIQFLTDEEVVLRVPC
jgi:hypothetical protein